MRRAARARGASGSRPTRPTPTHPSSQTPNISAPELTRRPIAAAAVGRLQTRSEHAARRLVQRKKRQITTSEALGTNPAKHNPHDLLQNNLISLSCEIIRRGNSVQRRSATAATRAGAGERDRAKSPHPAPTRPTLPPRRRIMPPELVRRPITSILLRSLQVSTHSTTLRGRAGDETA